MSLFYCFSFVTLLHFVFFYYQHLFLSFAFYLVFTLFHPSVISLSSLTRLSSPSSPALPSVPLCLCFTSYRVVPLLVSILFAACESISRNKNFTNPINYAHFIFITRLHRPRRCDNSLMIQPLSWDISLPLLSSPPPPTPLLPLYPAALGPELLTRYRILQ